MTHLRSKRLPTWSGASPGAGRTLVVVPALPGSPGLGAAGGAGAAPATGVRGAPGGWSDRPHGFASGSHHPGRRPWHPGGEPDAVARLLFGDTDLPTAVRSSPWTDMSGFSWKDVRFTEYRTHGPGAGVTADRPQLPAAEAPPARSPGTSPGRTTGRRTCGAPAAEPPPGGSTRPPTTSSPSLDPEERAVQ